VRFDTYRSNIEAIEGIDTTGLSKEPLMKTLTRIRYETGPDKGLHNSMIVFRRHDDIITEDIDVITDYSIMTLDA
jgi:hypothetical protein